jgi:secreted PhoX family phosphatase
MLFILDLDANTYTNATTLHGLFEGTPDQVKRVLDDDSGILYFTEEGGVLPGVHARDATGRFFTILEGDFNDETTGLSFSPDRKFMYVAFQERGLLFAVWRTDGLQFNGRSLNVKYHSTR